LINITAKEVKEQYKKIWPFVTPTCKAVKYSYVPFIEIKAIIDSCDRYKKIVFNEGSAECDFISLVAFCQACEIWHELHPTAPPLPIGRASAFALKGEKDKHTLVTFFCQDGVYFFDQRFKEFWLANSEKDFVFLIEM